MAFGLKMIFETSYLKDQIFIALCRQIEEMKQSVGSATKAIMNLHYIDGNPVYEGDQVQIGGNEAYYPVCRKHYFHPSMITEGE